jgi:hypothetical protein
LIAASKAALFLATEQHLRLTLLRNLCSYADTLPELEQCLDALDELATLTVTGGPACASRISFVSRLGFAPVAAALGIVSRDPEEGALRALARANSLQKKWLLGVSEPRLEGTLLSLVSAPGSPTFMLLESRGHMAATNLGVDLIDLSLSLLLSTDGKTIGVVRSALSRILSECTKRATQMAAPIRLTTSGPATILPFHSASVNQSVLASVNDFAYLHPRYGIDSSRRPDKATMPDLLVIDESLPYSRTVKRLMENAWRLLDIDGSALSFSSAPSDPRCDLDMEGALPRVGVGEGVLLLRPWRER